MTLTHIPRLDGLRAIAVLGVMLQHFTSNPFIQIFDFVGLFFVISGYLITRILLRYPQGYDLQGSASDFYWRRLLRLGPPLYLAIAVTALLGIADMRSQWWIHGLFLTNFKIAVSHHFGGAGHFWSLSVEEQFYIIWFLVLYFLPREHLPRAALAMILLAPVSRVALASAGIDQFEAGPGVLLPLKCDGLGFGAALALYSERKDCVTIQRFLSSPYVIACAGLLTVICGWFASMIWLQPVTATAFTIFAAAIVSAAIGPPVRMLAWLEWSWLQAIGKMSYGVYVYHFFVPQIWKLMGLPGDWMSGVVFLLASLGLAKLSWVYIEKPVLRWRDRRWQFAFNTRSSR